MKWKYDIIQLIISKNWNPLKHQTKKNSYTKITARIMGITLTVTLIFAYVYGEYLKSESIEKLSKSDAKQTSKLVFESLYSAMERGWNQEDLENIILRLNKINKDLKINVYRSEVVVRDYADIPRDKKIRETDPSIKKALTNQEVLNILKSDNIDYYYPIVAKEQCLKCHTSAKEGDVLGVINILYPVIDLKVSLNEMINFFIYFFIIFTIVLFLVLFIEFDKYLLKPIRNFVVLINNISKSRDITQRIEKIDDVEEISSMQEVFNTMLDSIEFQFYNDDLTQLPNRRKLIEILEKRDNKVLMIINIDKFQEINDLYGHNEGDNILQEFANFLQTHLLEDTMLFRLHSDEYGLLFSKNFDLEFFTSYTNTLITAISKNKFFVDDKKSNIFLNCTIGISHGNRLLLANSDIALKQAKKRKKEFLIYDPSMQVEHEYEQNLQWTKRIKDAIKENKIVSLFQPIVECKTQKIVKYESLIRMVDSKGEYISPFFFLELAKKNKLYHELTKIVIYNTFEVFKNSDYKVSINLTVDDILNIEIIDLLKEKLKETGIGSRIVFEIIESEGIENFERVMEFIIDIKKYGCEISIDDFGTGYSNFEYLMKLKVDYIKIDASMIKDIDTNRESEMITETIVDFAKKFGIKTIAEYVYTKSVYEKVNSLGVDYAQGYYFGKPEPLKK